MTLRERRKTPKALAAQGGDLDHHVTPTATPKSRAATAAAPAGRERTPAVPSLDLPVGAGQRDPAMPSTTSRMQPTSSVASQAHSSESAAFDRDTTTIQTTGDVTDGLLDKIQGLGISNEETAKEDNSIKVSSTGSTGDAQEIQPVTAVPAPSKLRGLAKDDESTRYSKTLAYLLRHGAEKERLPMRSDGYVRVLDILVHPKLVSLSWPLMHELVKTNPKQRFVLEWGWDPTPQHAKPRYLKKGEKRPPGAANDELPLVKVDAATVVPDGQSQSERLPPVIQHQVTTPDGIPKLVSVEYFVRAAQGHSIKTVTTEHLDRVNDDAEGAAMVGEMVHGSRAELWDVIRECLGIMHVNQMNKSDMVTVDLQVKMVCLE